jgi:hypothetical protein
MVLVGLGLLYLNKNNRDRFIDINISNKSLDSFRWYMMGWMSALVICMNAIPAVLVAVNNNPKQKLLYGVIGLLISDLYLLQWSIRKYVFNK